jgi:hypothetical protein
MDLRSTLADLGLSLLAALGLITMVNIEFSQPRPVSIKQMANPELVLNLNYHGTQLNMADYSTDQVTSDTTAYAIRVQGSISPDLYKVIQRSIPLHLDFSTDWFTLQGQRRQIRLRHTIVYHSLSKSWRIQRSWQTLEALPQVLATTEYHDLEIAIADLQTLYLKPPSPRPRFIRIHLSLNLDDTSSHEWQKTFWGNADPRYLWEFK